MGVLAKPDLPPGATPDWTIPQGFERYSDANHQTWVTLYERQAWTNFWAWFRDGERAGTGSKTNKCPKIKGTGCLIPSL
ncbi:MAG: hypothetical protein WA624_22070 [Methylocella sp.]